MSDVVIGEAVVLDLRLARLASRSLAFALDVLVQFVALLIFWLIYASGAGGVDSALAAAIGLLISIVVLVGYPVLFETLSRGRTLGKLALGLRVVRDDGGPIRFRHALVRGLTGFFVDFWALGLGGLVAMVVSLSSTKGKRVGDFLAGTVVIRERIPKTESAPVMMPPALAGWAAGLNMSTLPDHLALAVRQYLTRYHQLNADARDNLGAQLATEVSRHLGVPLPTDGWAATYLAAVLAERRAREQARLARSPIVPAPPAPRPATPETANNPFAPPG